jgi:Protein of unknown function (DUF4242)
VHEEDTMPTFVIERDLPGLGQLSGADLQVIAQKSVQVLGGMDGRAQWLHSYVTDDKLVCVYIAEDAAAVQEHAAGGGFPCTAVRTVRTMIDPTTAEV